MQLEHLCRTLAPNVDVARVREIEARLPDGPDDWRKLAALTAACQPGRALALSGGQGAGKTTLARLIAAAFATLGQQCVSLSIDDFYLTRRERLELAGNEHPLLATRGVPGTHDVALAEDVLEAILRGERVAVPRFDKGRDDRAPESTWESVGPDVDVVVFEGWCLGATPQPDGELGFPVNTLERDEDADAMWRRFVNEACANYASLWSLLDFWIFLEVPDMDAVRRWRRQQEVGLPDSQRMSDTELDRFVAHYERLTLWLRSQLPARADWLVRLGEGHEIRGVQAGGKDGQAFR